MVAASEKSATKTPIKETQRGLRAVPASASMRWPWIVLACLAAGNLYLAFYLYRAFSGPRPAPPPADEQAGLIAFAGSAAVTLPMSLLIAGCGPPMPRKTQNLRTYVCKVWGFCMVLAIMQVLMQVQLFHWKFQEDGRINLPGATAEL
eukprot:CAMPEP_0206443890 /NCGR_PEP_ID=MMETSP0324_2-20121206/14617_1 /ASSEMBLY_ACC=CAM_ASM_000836 /TAXON_ID=2866 /ORGANISM="Crypthecodinium cohnii, Strain Seligo" /LENGTH=147 /DNA_ID=CAMNT_0053911871 /DNA_START=145 /DNA_END=588 /DNA_ORIENTATION=+